MPEKQDKTSDNKPKRDERGRLLPGNTANPDGRPIETEEEKDIRKATKELIQDYKDKLADALPQISPILIMKAMRGDIVAIKEINDRVMGKSQQAVDLTTGGEKIYNWGTYGKDNNIQPKVVDPATPRTEEKVEGSGGPPEGGKDNGNS